MLFFSKDLINRIQCTRVQYRDSNLVETNEDTTSDRIGDFFAGLLDLETSNETSVAEPESRILNETVVVESRTTADIDLPPVTEDAISNGVMEEDEVEVRKTKRPIKCDVREGKILNLQN